MRLTLAFMLALVAAGCSTKPKGPDPNAPRPDDIPTVLTCCVAVDAEGTPAYSTMPEEQCPEENRNPVDTCDVGPGEVPRKQ
jgi:hypothetical protein